MRYEGKWFRLHRAYLRAASEHTLGGKHSPAEIQLQHSLPEGDEQLWISVLLNSPEDKPAEKAFLQRKPIDSEAFDAEEKLVKGYLKASKEIQPHFTKLHFAAGDDKPDYTPPGSGEAGFSALLQVFLAESPPLFGQSLDVDTSGMDLNSFIGAKTNFFQYAGSSTMVPCAETSTWLVSQKPRSVSGGQVKALEKVLKDITEGKGNFRDTQPWHSRLFAVRQSTLLGSLPATGDEAFVGDGREFKGITYAKDAETLAVAAANYAAALDDRLQNAAKEHTKALFAPTPKTEAVPIPNAASQYLNGRRGADWAADKIRKEVQEEAVEAVKENMQWMKKPLEEIAKQQLQQNANVPVPMIEHGIWEHPGLPLVNKSFAPKPMNGPMEPPKPCPPGQTYQPTFSFPNADGSFPTADQQQRQQAEQQSNTQAVEQAAVAAYGLPPKTEGYIYVPGGPGEMGRLGQKYTFDPKEYIKQMQAAAYPPPELTEQQILQTKLLCNSPPCAPAAAAVQ